MNVTFILFYCFMHWVATKNERIQFKYIRTIRSIVIDPQLMELLKFNIYEPNVWQVTYMTMILQQ